MSEVDDEVEVDTSGTVPVPVSRNLYTFAVGNSSSGERAKHVLEGLHKLVELGKQAASALRAIEKHGFCADSVPYLDSLKDQGDDKYGSIRYRRLPKIQPVSQDDIKDLGQFEMKLGDVKDVEVKGQYFKQMRLFVSLNCVEQTDFFGGMKPIRLKIHVGDVRLRSKCLALINSSGNSMKIYKVPNMYPDGMEPIKYIASILAEHMVRVPDKKAASQKTMDLRKALVGWLLDLEVPQKVLEQVHNLQAVREVMEA